MYFRRTVLTRAGTLSAAPCSPWVFLAGPQAFPRWFSVIGTTTARLLYHQRFQPRGGEGTSTESILDEDDSADALGKSPAATTTPHHSHHGQSHRPPLTGTNTGAGVPKPQVAVSEAVGADDDDDEVGVEAVPPKPMAAAAVPVSVTGSDGKPHPNEPLNTFAELLPRLPQWLQSGVTSLGYTAPTSIQAHTISLLLNKHNMVGLAPTGSGKTVAFAIPSLSMMGSIDGNTQILIVCPVRELVQQTAKVIRSLTKHNVAINVCEAYGGADRAAQIRQMERGVDVIVATPGRLNDLLDSSYVNLENVSFIVFDEADRLLDMGFEPQIQRIMENVPKNRKFQTMMWSATWAPEVQRLARTYLGPASLMVKAGAAGETMQVNENIAQHVFVVGDDKDRVTKLGELFKSGQINARSKTIFFVQTKDTCESVADFLGETLSRVAGISPRAVAAIHGGMTQQRRDWTINSFRRGDIRILVATDVVGRGLDFPDVEAIVNYDTPKEIDQYVHRIGRTGRAGRKGSSFTFIVRRQGGGLCKDLVDYLKKSKHVVPKELVDEMIDNSNRFSERRSYGRGGGRGGFGGRGRGGMHSDRSGFGRPSRGGREFGGAPAAPSRFGEASGGRFGDNKAMIFDDEW